MSSVYLTVAEAAEKLGISPAELVEKARRREVRGFQDRGDWKFRSQDIEKLAQQTTCRWCGAKADAGALFCETCGGELAGAPPTELQAAIAPKPQEPKAPDPESPLVFISAKSEDYDTARRYYHFLIARGVRAFLACESLPDMGRSDYRKTIDDTIDAARHMIVVTSSAANVRSRWVEWEWGMFHNEKLSNRKDGNLITVIDPEMRVADLPSTLRYYEVIPDGPDALAKVHRYVRR